VPSSSQNPKGLKQLEKEGNVAKGSVERRGGCEEKIPTKTEAHAKTIEACKKQLKRGRHGKKEEQLKKARVLWPEKKNTKPQHTKGNSGRWETEIKSGKATMLLQLCI